ncbi:MAG TPA: lipid-A-disaccharide synthase [Verrucomicrobiota bacterium]|nr:lipid-A-disaccharide synthase [Verrucomicrobiota bacterium]HRR64529.1 lipid-A-disaccharide synthase [Candidatus Paceibacterota bacterium]MBP8013802.1 lipid-A-disaccharide synthase [Verrucomicrobiota bacterium]MDI9373077.1 lipid-A-disaccharide synthase [Verrucomicrobiota bacterium]NLH85760.1 lipid-A-disaccharide synthase [Verrucomicrobiota bacterium]
MRPGSFMLIAGEASGDALAAELVHALRQEYAEAPAVPTTDYQPRLTTLAPRFFGAGGPQMAAAGVELDFDMTAHSVIGLSDALRHYGKFRRLFRRLLQLARARQPEVIVCVDFSGFNRRFARAIRQGTRPRADGFHNWKPRIIQYVSPQVWASRAGRARQMARDYNLVLSIYPFEKDWYAQRVPQLPVEFVGHPLVDRYGPDPAAQDESRAREGGPLLLMLPGSRAAELRRHLPVMLSALDLIRAKVVGLRARMVLPHDALAQQARALGLPRNLELRIGGLSRALAEADVALASTGTVTTECAYFGVPTVALYKTSWSTWQIGRRIVTVKYLAMPNLLAGEEVFPEFIQSAANAGNLAGAVVALLRDEARRARIKARLREVAATLGPPGAARRAAQAILATFQGRP